MTAFVNAIAVAVPPHDVHGAFLDFAQSILADDRERFTLARMAERSGIEHRYSTFTPGEPGADWVDAEGFYRRGAFPGTASRMARYAEYAPGLVVQAVEQLGAAARDVTHLVLASCTGFMAPGLDQVVAQRLGLPASVQRTVVGFMGCYGAVPALRIARDAVRADRDARVLVVNVELCTLHLQETPDVGKLLTAMLFADAATAALVTSEERGIALGAFRSAALPDTADLMSWHIGDQGFDMHLSGRVPAAIGGTLRVEADRNDGDGLLGGERVEHFAHWAVHAGGRTVLDAVQTGLRLGPVALNVSRGVLRDIGNVSSATLMAVLSRMMGTAPGTGLALAFGPGLTTESFRFEVLPA